MIRKNEGDERQYKKREVKKSKRKKKTHATGKKNRTGITYKIYKNYNGI